MKINLQLGSIVGIENFGALGSIVISVDGVSKRAEVRTLISIVGVLARALSTSSKAAAKARSFILRKRMFSLRDRTWRLASVRDDKRK